MSSDWQNCVGCGKRDIPEWCRFCDEPFCDRCYDSHLEQCRDQEAAEETEDG